jgi:hypothetical protein
MRATVSSINNNIELTMKRLKRRFELRHSNGHTAAFFSRPKVCREAGIIAENIFWGHSFLPSSVGKMIIFAGYL